MSLALERLVAGTPIPFAGNRVSVVSPELALRFQPGDQLLVEQVSGELTSNGPGHVGARPRGYWPMNACAAT